MRSGPFQGPDRLQLSTSLSWAAIGAIDCIDTVDGRKNSPLIRPFKGINKEINRIFRISYIEIRVVELRFLAFSRGYGGFRELREAGRKHFHLSWYL